jgi:hypothetical protein
MPDEGAGFFKSQDLGGSPLSHLGRSPPLSSLKASVTAKRSASKPSAPAPRNQTRRIKALRRGSSRSELIQKALKVASLLLVTLQFSGTTAEFFQQIPGPAVARLAAKGRIALATSPGRIAVTSQGIRLC